MAAVPAFANPSVSAKRAEAQQVMAQLGQLSSSLERARSQYVVATNQLAKIQQDLKVNRHELKVARHNLKSSQKVIAARLVTLYTSDQASTLEVILGAQSLDDMITRMDSAKSVTGLDARVLSQVKTFRTAVKRNHALLAKAHATQQRVVSQRASAKASIASQISRSNSLLASIKGEIAQIVAADAARQRRLAAAAQVRLAVAHRASQAQTQETVVGAIATAPESLTVAAPPSSFSGAVGVAMAQLGKPYVWGAAGPDSFDCSGLVVYAFAAVGKSVSRTTYSLWAEGVPVARDQLQPGDLVFFNGLGHMGIYIGNNQMVHSPRTGDVVKISSLSESWYASTYMGARRIL